MIYSHHWDSQRLLNIQQLIDELGVKLEYAEIIDKTSAQGKHFWVWQPNVSTTFFQIDTDVHQGTHLYIDGLAATEDYHLFPYLAHGIGVQLSVLSHENLFVRYGEEWMSHTIGEAVAYLKVYLSLALPYVPPLCRQIGSCINASTLATMATSYASSTPRIYGYVQHLMRQQRLATLSAENHITTLSEDSEIEADVPQHHSIGRVKSWQTNGEETWESFAQEDVQMLLDLGKSHQQRGQNVDGVVLNDLGTIYQEGIGVTQNGELAAYWFEKAIEQGDYIYAPANLGDLHRKGCPPLSVSLSKAFEAYLLGEDPYSIYRVGQGYAEGWLGTPDPSRSRLYIERAAQLGHHLAIKHLNKNQEK